MNISSTPFIRNDYWPDYNDIDILNKRIDEAENETSLVNIRLTADIENVSNNLNSYKKNMADAVITNNIIVNNLNANYAIGKYANFINTNTYNAYIENLTVNKPVFDITLNTPHVENITSIGGNFYEPNLFNVAVDNLFLNTQLKPVNSSAVLGYDSKGRVIPVKATFNVGFPENADYLFTDHVGTARAGTAATDVGISSNLITAHAVKNAIDNVNNSFKAVNTFINNGFNNVNNSFNKVNNSFNNVNNSFNNVNKFVNNGFNNVNNSFNKVNIFVNNGFNNINNSFNDVANNFNNVNNTANNLLDNVDYLKTALAPLLNLTPANVSGWINSTTPVNIKGITSFVAAPFAAPVTTGSDVGDGAKLNLNGTTATLALPGFQWTMENMFRTFAACSVFNQNIQIPNGVTTMTQTFQACLNFNQNIQIPNSVTIMNSVFAGDHNFNQNILIPNSVTQLYSCFSSCSALSQNILIPNSVTNMVNCFSMAGGLTQSDMYIYSQNVENMYGAFLGCHINNIHIPTSVPKSTSNYMYNCLVNGNTGITFPAANIFNDLPVDIQQWPPV